MAARFFKRMSAPATMPAERGSAPTRGAWLREFWASSIGKKQIVAVTGAVLVLYVIAHMFGNLKVFQGPGHASGSIDAYAEFLRTVGEPVIPRDGLLWAVRVFLLGAFVTHIVAVWQLAARNRAARPEGRTAPVIKRSLSARTMQVGGLFLLFFVVFHILHFTTGTIDPSELPKGAVYDNLDQAFQHPLFVVDLCRRGRDARLPPPPRGVELLPDRRLGQAEPQPDHPPPRER